MNSKRLLIAGIITLILTLRGGGGAVAQRGPEARRGGAGATNNEVSINFDNAPIIEVIDIMSHVTGRI